MSKTLILSDIHFCRSRSSAVSPEQLRPLWSGCDALVLNGDTTEAHAKSRSGASEQHTQTLVELASKDGVRTTLICGNHDPVVSNIESLWFCDKRVLVFHGHAPFPTITPWNWRSKYIAEVRLKSLAESGDGFEEQLAAVRKASFDAVSGAFRIHRPSMPHMLALGPRAAFRVLYCWWKFPSLVSAWVENYASTASFIITGHTHHAGIWKRKNRVIINTGCFGFPSHPRAVIIDDNKLTVYRLRLKHSDYSFGRICGSWDVR